MNEIERRNNQDFWGMVITIIFGLMILNMTACGSMGKVPDMQVKGQGYCWGWSKIENEASGKWLCYKPCPYSEHYCLRQKGHTKRHHAHGVKNCYFTWK